MDYVIAPPPPGRPHRPPPPTHPPGRFRHSFRTCRFYHGLRQCQNTESVMPKQILPQRPNSPFPIPGKRSPPTLRPPGTAPPGEGKGWLLSKAVYLWALLLRELFIVRKLCESPGQWPSWAFRPNEPYGFRGCKAILNHVQALVTVCP